MLKMVFLRWNLTIALMPSVQRGPMRFLGWWVSESNKPREKSDNKFTMKHFTLYDGGSLSFLHLNGPSTNFFFTVRNIFLLFFYFFLIFFPIFDPPKPPQKCTKMGVPPRSKKKCQKRSNSNEEDRVFFRVGRPNVHHSPLSPPWKWSKNPVPHPF